MLGPLILAAAAGSETVPWKSGEPLPNFRLAILDRTGPVSLASFRGKKLLLVEFASW